MFRRRTTGLVIWTLAIVGPSAWGAELSVGSFVMPECAQASVVVSGEIANENTYGVTIRLQIVPRAGAVGVVSFTDGITDIVQEGDAWPGVGTFTAFDTDAAMSDLLNGVVDDDGSFQPLPTTFSGPLASFPVVASANAAGVWDVLLSTGLGASTWAEVATTLISGTITVGQLNSPTVPLGRPGIAKNRYVSFVSNNAGRQTALRVTLTTLPSPFASFNGTKMWVGAPALSCELPGMAGTSCSGGTFWVARLACDPVYIDWTVFGVIHVYGDEIVPNATYGVQAIGQVCDAAIESNFSASLAIATSGLWGDITGDCSVNPCTPPDGIVNIVDVTAVNDSFQFLPSAPRKARCDLDASVPNRLVDIMDTIRVVAAQGGAGYPFTGPTACPPPGGGGGPPGGGGLE